MSAFLSALDLIDRATMILGLSDDRAPSYGPPYQESPDQRVPFYNDVAALLDTGDESLLRRAMETVDAFTNTAPSHSLYEVSLELRQTILEAADQAATNLRVAGSLRLPDGWIVPTLIPLTIVHSANAALPDTLDASIVQHLTDVWHNHPIGQPPHRLLVMPRLYTAHEIPFTWAGQRQWLQRFRAHFSGAVDDLLQIPTLVPSTARRQAAVSAISSDATIARDGERRTFGLRFLVVASFQPDHGLPAFDLEAYAQGDQGLPEHILPILEAAFPTAPQIAVGEPGDWGDALETAIVLHNTEGLGHVFGGDAPVPLVVHGHVIGPDVIWDVRGPQTLRHRWIVRGDPLEELSDLLRALDTLNATAVQVILPIHRAQDCPWDAAASASA